MQFKGDCTIGEQRSVCVITGYDGSITHWKMLAAHVTGIPASSALLAIHDQFGRCDALIGFGLSGTSLIPCEEHPNAVATLVLEGRPVASSTVNLHRTQTVRYYNAGSSWCVRFDPPDDFLDSVQTGLRIIAVDRASQKINVDYKIPKFRILPLYPWSRGGQPADVEGGQADNLRPGTYVAEFPSASYKDIPPEPFWLSPGSITILPILTGPSESRRNTLVLKLVANKSVIAESWVSICPAFIKFGSGPPRAARVDELGEVAFEDVQELDVSATVVLHNRILGAVLLDLRRSTTFTLSVENEAIRLIGEAQ